MVSKDFYDNAFAGAGYAHYPGPQGHPFLPLLGELVGRLGLAGRRCLEVGCGRGYLQDVVEDYTGLDLSDSVRQYLHKPFVQGCATALPFADGSFGCLWTYATLEHIPQPETALVEMRRVLCDGGVLLLAPAWQCRPWAAAGLPVRPYRELPWRLRVEKALIPVRDSVPTGLVHPAAAPGRLLATHSVGSRRRFGTGAPANMGAVGARIRTR